ncbi:hypothetical protein Tco_0073671 [Tanacetum coccineum]
MNKESNLLHYNAFPTTSQTKGGLYMVMGFGGGDGDGDEGLVVEMLVAMAMGFGGGDGDGDEGLVCL